jgi:mannose-1-phosphate guanylyltransferase
MTQPNYYGLILAGGRGTRFWPRSRRARAKQVLQFFGESSLIQQTVDRLRPVLPPERIWILTNAHLRDEIVSQLPEVPPEQIIAEPAARNTAPAIGLAAKILQDRDPDSIMGVFPSDHIILHPDRYVPLVDAAFRTAAEGRIVVLGIEPRWAETGYGYIEFPEGLSAGSTAEVLSFREKPDLAVAEQYVASGRFSWNAGMFFWRTSVILDELRRQKPGIVELLESLPRFRSAEFDSALADVFPRAEEISIDYAVLEHAANRAGLIATDIGWNDVGSWNAVYELLPRDPDGNAGRGDAVALGAAGTYFDVDGKLVALLGVKDLIVVDTPDALLVADRSRAQDVGKIVKMLEQRKRDDLL